MLQALVGGDVLRGYIDIEIGFIFGNNMLRREGGGVSTES